MARKQNVHPWIKIIGKILSFAQVYVETLKNMGATDEDFDQIDNVERVKRSAEAFMAGKTLKQGLRVVVDYGLSLKEMIRRGNYDWTNEDITAKRFEVTGNGEQELWIELLHYGKDMTTDAVLADMDQRGYRPAKIEELLALGVQHPDEQRKYPIPGLGSSCVFYGNRYVPYLSLTGYARDLGLSYDGDEWNVHCRFPVVRKSV